MNIRSKLEGAQLPKFVADLRHANQFLKIFSVAALVAAILAFAILFYQLGKETAVVVLSAKGSRLVLNEAPDAALQVEVAIHEYIKHRYSWEPKSIKSHLAIARKFIKDSALKSFDQGLSEVLKFAVDRNVTQRGYAATVEVDLKSQTAIVKGDRVTSIQGLTAAGLLNLTLQFEGGPRTQDNPWGVYIVREKSE